MFMSGKLRIEHFGNDEFIRIRSFTRLAAMKISYRKDYFLRVFRKWKQDLPNTGANSGSYCLIFHRIRPILRGSNSGLNSQFLAQREDPKECW